MKAFAFPWASVNKPLQACFTEALEKKPNANCSTKKTIPRPKLQFTCYRKIVHYLKKTFTNPADNQWGRKFLTSAFFVVNGLKQKDEAGRRREALALPSIVLSYLIPIRAGLFLGWMAFAMVNERKKEISVGQLFSVRNSESGPLPTYFSSESACLVRWDDEKTLRS